METPALEYHGIADNRIGALGTRTDRLFLPPPSGNQIDRREAANAQEGSRLPEGLSSHPPPGNSLSARLETEDRCPFLRTETDGGEKRKGPVWSPLHQALPLASLSLSISNKHRIKPWQQEGAT